jgi:hypothetical protein
MIYGGRPNVKYITCHMNLVRPQSKIACKVDWMVCGTFNGKVVIFEWKRWDGLLGQSCERIL